MWSAGTAREALNQNFAALCLHGELRASSSLSVPDQRERQEGKDDGKDDAHEK